MVIFLQRTFTSLVHARAGRTHYIEPVTGPEHGTWLRHNPRPPQVQVNALFDSLQF